MNCEQYQEKLSAFFDGERSLDRRSVYPSLRMSYMSNVLERNN